MASTWTEHEIDGQSTNRRVRRALRKHKVSPGVRVILREETKLPTHDVSVHPQGGSSINPDAGVKR